MHGSDSWDAHPIMTNYGESSDSIYYDCDRMDTPSDVCWLFINPSNYSYL